MTSHTAISPQKAADRRDASGQMALFTEDTRFLVFRDITSAEPSQELPRRESLAPVFGSLNTYNVSMHTP